MKKVFASGSCRLLTTLHNGRGMIEPIHSMFRNFTGINFLGKLHNTKQHIQFIQWLHDRIELPPHILESFLTSYSKSIGYIDHPSRLPSKKKEIRDAFNECEYYIIEVCSLKLYEKEGYQVQFELTHDYRTVVQSEESLYNDLEILYNLLPAGKTLILQTHFRPNIIYNDPSKAIEKREAIYTVVESFCKLHENAHQYDPSILVQSDKSLFDGDTHFTEVGHAASFNYMYKNFLTNTKGR